MVKTVNKKIMIYIRNIFTQDLRDGKQIAFPKEASNLFFNFFYQTNDADRQINFKFKESDSSSPFYSLNDTVITTRLYAAGTESRIDGQLKRFLIDELNAVVGSKIIFRKINNENYEFYFIPQNTSKNVFISTLLNNKNHEVVYISTDESTSVSEDLNAFNKIYFGPPGTGKSHAIKEELKKVNAKAENYSRVTFHPDYDYHSFVGGYKPINERENIKYRFVPQIFTDLYVKAWQNAKNNEHYYLVIEEINRGNCAEIFGDIFQLLDRNPEYNIEPSTELKEYLEQKELKINEDITEDDQKIKLLFEGKLQMPDNLSILASMNTSDQSLYPMDSAFKRRWDWHYVPIDLKCSESNFTITIDENNMYSWLEFLAKVNYKIYNVTKSEDKQIGNWFVNCRDTNYIGKNWIDRNDQEKKIYTGLISKELFINKVLFYLWNDVFKDEVFNPDNIFIEKDEKGTKIRDISFNNFYSKDEQDRLLLHLLKDILVLTPLELISKQTAEYNQEDNVIPKVAEDIAAPNANESVTE